MYPYPSRRGWPSMMDIAMRQLGELAETSLGDSSSPIREPGYTYHSDKSAVNIRVELPGVAPANLEVHTEAGKVVVKGTRFGKNTDTSVEQMSVEPNDENASATEDGAEVKQEPVPEVVFAKEFHVPQSVDADATRASLKHGLLELYIPKKQKHKTRQIKIDAST